MQTDMKTSSALVNDAFANVENYEANQTLRMTQCGELKREQKKNLV